jgi:hypothetical protein
MPIGIPEIARAAGRVLPWTRLADVSHPAYELFPLRYVPLPERPEGNRGRHEQPGDALDEEEQKREDAQSRQVHRGSGGQLIEVWCVL